MQAENPFKGPSSYEDGDKFYGRENEIKELSSLIKNDTLTLLFSRSGTGKSSLIRAGLFPFFKIEFEFFPIYIHLNDAAVKQTSATSLCDFVIKRCEEEIRKQFTNKENFKFKFPENGRPDSLFEFIHNLQILETDASSSTEYIVKPVLVFDQFEEIFTNPIDKNQLQFLLKEIRCLVENEVPEYLKETIINSETDEYFKLRNTLKNKQKNFRILFSFREEYLPQFESLKKEIPSIRFTNSRNRLEPFTIQTASDIIVKTAPLISAGTACIVAENIATVVEGFDEKRVDPFLLSLICQIIYPDLLGGVGLTDDAANARIKSLVENALESYVSKIYNEVAPETKRFVEEKLITSDGKKNSVNYNDVEDNSLLRSDILKLVDRPDSRLLSVGQFLDSKHITILHDRLLPPLIKRREERKAKEEEDALIVRRQELETKNRKKQRRLFVIFFTIALLLGIWLFANIKQKEKARRLQDTADKATEEARQSKLEATQLQDRAVMEKRTADMATQKADIATKKADDAILQAIAQTNLAKLAKNKLDVAVKQYQSQKQLTASLQEQITIINLQQDLLSNKINSQTTGSEALYNSVYDQLLALKKKQKEEKYNDLLKSVKAAIEAKNLALSESNPIEGFNKAKELWELNRNIPILDSILLQSFINKTLFYKESISLDESNDASYDNNKTLLSFAYPKNTNESQPFTFNNGNKIYFAVFNESLDSVAIDHRATLVSNDSLFSLNSLAYNGNKITALINDSLLTYSPGDSAAKGKKVDIDKHFREILSPNGKYLITYTDYDSVILWKINDFQLEGKRTLTARPNQIRSIIFSGNSEKILIAGANGDLTVYSTENPAPKTGSLQIQNIRPKNNYDRIQAANFTPDGTKLIVASAYSVSYYDLSGGNAGSLIPILRRPFYDWVNTISISADSKKMLFETSRDIFIVERKKQDSILLSPSVRYATDIIYKSFQDTAYNNRTAAFLNSNSIVTVDNKGKLFLWKIYPEFKTLEEAFNSIKLPPLSLIEQLEANSTEAVYKAIIASNDGRLMIDAAQIYLQKYSLTPDFSPDSSTILKVKELKSKAILLLNANAQANADKLMEIYQGFIEPEDWAPDNAEYTLKIIQLAKKYKKFTPRELSTQYGNLSFFSFFHHNFKEALVYVDSAIKLDSTNDFIYTNLALAQLFNKQFPQAEKTYADFKDRTYRDSNTKFIDGFKADFKVMEEHNIIDQNDLLIYEEVKKIKHEILKIED